MILCVGEILVDLIGRHEDGDVVFSRYPGGAPFNVACDIQKQDCEVGFVGDVGIHLNVVIIAFERACKILLFNGLGHLLHNVCEIGVKRVFVGIHIDVCVHSSAKFGLLVAEQLVDVGLNVISHPGNIIIVVIVIVHQDNQEKIILVCGRISEFCAVLRVRIILEGVLIIFDASAIFEVCPCRSNAGKKHHCRQDDQNDGHYEQA